MGNKIVLKSFDEINQRNKTLRKRFLIFTIPFIILIMIFTAQVSVMYYLAGQTKSHFMEGDFATSLEYAEKQKEYVFLEEWLAYYNAGVTKKAQKDYSGAIDELKEAYEIIMFNSYNEERLCKILIPLLESYNLLAEEYKEKGDLEKAESLFKTAMMAVETAPNLCYPPEANAPDAEGDEPSDENGENEEEPNNSNEGKGESQLEQVGEQRDRANSGLEEINGTPSEPGQDGQPSDVPEPGQGDTADAREQLQQELDEGTAERTRELSENGSSGLNGSGSFEEQTNSKPW